MSNPLVISAANLNTIENNMQVLNNNISSVTSDIVNINGKISSFNQDVNSIKNSMQSLEDEIHAFMKDVRENTLVANAQNDILLKQNELNKKFGNYDGIRHMLGGLLDSVRLNLVSRKTLSFETEKILMNAPNYFLSYVLIAISSWFQNDKVKAQGALNEALKIDSKKTAMILFLIHLKLNRHDAALKWLKYYLDIQDPTSLDRDFVILLDTYANDVLTNDMKNILKNSLNSYVIQLKNNNEIINQEERRWKNFFLKSKKSITENDLPLIYNFTNGFSSFSEGLSSSFSYFDAYFSFEDLTNKAGIEAKDVSHLLNNVIYSSDRNELFIKQSIQRDKLIIENNGNIGAADEGFQYSSSNYDLGTNLYTIFSNILLIRKDTSVKVKRLAISYLKDIIINALNNALPFENKASSMTSIKIGSWTGNTNNGENELELKKQLTMANSNNLTQKLNNYSFIDTRVIFATIGLIIGLIVSFGFNFAIGMIIALICLIVDVYFIYNIYKSRDVIVKNNNNQLNEDINILENILAEIVDAHFITIRGKDNYDYLINYINSFNEDRL